MVTPEAPDRGDVVWLDFDPQAGREQRGRRPALILSPRSYSRLTGLALACPITSQVKGYRFEVLIPPGLPVHGAILSDHVRNIDWRSRKAETLCSLPSDVAAAVISRIETLLKS